MVVITLTVFLRTAGTFLVRLRPIASSDDSEHVCNKTWQAAEVFVGHLFIKRFKRQGGVAKGRKTSER